MQEQYGPALRRQSLRIWGLFGLIFLAISALVALTVDRPRELLEPAIYLYGAWVIALPFVLVGGRRSIGREIAPAFLEPTELRLEDSGFSVSRQTFSGSGSWAHFQTWSELAGFFVLSHAPNVVFLLPKRALEPEEIVVARELLARRIGLEAGAKAAGGETSSESVE